MLKDSAAVITLGFDSYTEQGPGIFLARLERELTGRGRFSEQSPDVWVQLPFQPLPAHIEARVQEGLTRILVRMNGCYCSRYHVITRPVVLPVPVLDDLRSRRINRRKNAQMLKTLMKADGIVFQSAFSWRLTQRFVCRTPPGVVLYNGVSLESFSPEGPVLADFSGRLNLLASHSFRPYHRLHDTFRILAVLKRKLPAVRPHLHILGGDDNSGSFDYARKTADRLALVNLEDYTFWGKLPFDDLPIFYRSCDLMLNLSYWDACPNVVIEALACGLPVVGVNHGGVAELVGPAGVLVDEHIPFTYLDHLDFNRMPKAPVARYAAAVEQAFLEQAHYRALALERAYQRFDIRLTADQYLQAAEGLLRGQKPQPKGSPKLSVP